MAGLLALPEDPRTAAFRALVDHLKGDPTLASVVRTWRSWEGIEGTEGESLEPGPDECPWVRLTPKADDSEYLARHTHAMPMLVSVETATHGLAAEDSMNLWGALQNALLPGGKAVLRGLGVSAITVLKPCYGIPDPTDQDVEMIVPEPGMIKLDMDFDY